MTHISIILRRVLAGLVEIAEGDNPQEIRPSADREYDDETLGVECGMIPKI